MIGHSKEGWGTAFCKEGNVIYEGDWHQGKRHGHGTHMSLQSGKLVQRYTGNYSSSNKCWYKSFFSYFTGWKLQKYSFIQILCEI